MCSSYTRAFGSAVFRETAETGNWGSARFSIRPARSAWIP